jgi:putative flavoprotein involved in K+ transport
MQMAGRTPRNTLLERQDFDVIVIGAGQAGLSVGYHLARAGVRFVILDAHERIGDSWRKRWDSLRLFTPAKLDGLDGMPFPAARSHFPTKDEMADYLEAYAKRFQLPVRSGVRVQRLFKVGDRYIARGAGVEFRAGQVVVAMAKYQRAKVPAFARALKSNITQIHSSDYRNLEQLAPGNLVLVGAGNSGADIAMEAARAGRRVWMAGRDTGQIPFRPERFLGRNLFVPLLLGFVFHRVLTVESALGRRAKHGVLTKGTPLIRVKRSDLAAAGVERTPRVAGVRDGMPLLEDERTLHVANVIWCNGFESGFDWIDLPVLNEDGEPIHNSGVVENQPGVYFVGLPFLHAMSSSMVHGVGRDAARVVRAIKLRLQSVAPAADLRRDEGIFSP